MKNIKIAMLSSNGIGSTIGNIGLCFELVVDFILFLLESAAHNLKSVFPHLFNSFFLLSMLCLFSLNLFYFFLQFPLRYFKFFPVFCEWIWRIFRLLFKGFDFFVLCWKFSLVSLQHLKDIVVIRLKLSILKSQIM